MKYIFSLLFLCTTHLSFSQMTISEMSRIYKMDMDQFESYALGKGYNFHRIDNDEDENVFGHIYSKGIKKETKYLKLYKHFYSDGVTVIYQTSNSNEFLNFKNQLKPLGFVLKSEKTFEETPFKIYRNSIYEIRISTNPDNFEIGLNKY